MNGERVAALLALILASLSGASCGHPGPAGGVSVSLVTSGATMTDAQFKAQVLDQTQPVMVVFCYSGCPECGTYAPTVSTFIQKYSGKISVVQVDSSANASLGVEYGVIGVPATMFFESGSAINNLIGSQSMTTLDQIAAEVAP